MCNSAMLKTINDIRRANLETLYKETGESWTRLADMADTQASYFSQVRTKNIKARRNIGTDVARKLESACGKPENWMDQNHSLLSEDEDLGGSHSSEELMFYDETPPGTGYEKIRFGSFHLQAGLTGFSVDYLDDDFEPLFFKSSWYMKRHLKPENLIACKVIGDSMEPTLHADDVVVINMASTDLKDGRVFAVNYEGQLVIKRLIRDAGQWWLQSDNSDKTRHPNKICTGDLCLIIGEIVHRQSEVI